MSKTDFDFIIGEWQVSHKRLERVLDNCTDWYEFGGTSSMRTILDGQGNVEELLLCLPEGDVSAAAFRSYNSQDETWSIWWLDMRNPSQLDVPVVGKFKDGKGEFIAKTEMNDAPVIVKFVWQTIDENTAHWEQAFSSDDGLTWETNWLMDFKRA